MASTERAEASQPDAAAEPITEQPQQPGSTDVAYSVFTSTQKKMIVFSASLGAVFSPMSTTIYPPSLNQIGRDLHVSSAKIILTVMTFLVCQIPRNCGPSSDRFPDTPRRSTHVDCWPLKSRREKADLHLLLYRLPRSEHQANSTKKLCGIVGASLPPKCWKQWYRSSCERRGRRFRYQCGASCLPWLQIGHVCSWTHRRTHPGRSNCAIRGMVVDLLVSDNLLRNILYFTIPLSPRNMSENRRWRLNSPSTTESVGDRYHT